jgi:NAD(P)-dependent dehydrogenase (short-subunit alcohol dehydrogenase family)
MDLQLNGKRALVTGGTRGIGRAIAVALAGEGADVSICARRGDEVAATVTAAGLAFGQACDVSKPDQLKAWIAASARHLGGIDIVVANASALASGASPEAFAQAFEVDLMHTVNAASLALAWLEKSAAGAIVAIASISGVEDYGYDEAAYGAMKAALLYYIKTLSGELAPRGIRANVVSPGTTYFRDGFWHKVEQDDPAGFAKAMANNPMGRMASPQDIAKAVIFLASPAASFITGANLVVDGGYTRRIQN